MNRHNSEAKNLVQSWCWTRDGVPLASTATPAAHSEV